MSKGFCNRQSNITGCRRVQGDILAILNFIVLLLASFMQVRFYKLILAAGKI